MEEKRIPILWEDGEMLFALKPCGIASQSPGMPERLAAEIGAETVYPVHRLDKEASGVMVYAKTKSAAAALSAAISNGKMEKEYLAMVTGTPAPSGEMRDLLYHDPRRNKSFVVTRARRGVREAILTYEVIRTEGDRSLVKVRLETGRTHQIRVQFASRKHPLVGDKRYGSTVACKNVMLFSASIGFCHPTKGESMTVSLPLPAGAVWDRFAKVRDEE